MNNFKMTTTLLLLLGVLSFSCTSTNAQQTNSVNAKYEIESEEYETLTDEAIQHLVAMEFPDFYEMLSDDIEYYLPDGDADTRTSLIGKDAVMGFWNSYKENSGTDKMVATDFVHFPISVKDELNYTKVTGVVVLSYFSLKLYFGAEEASVRVNFGMHYNADKKIDRIYTYYDRTPIIEAAKRNILSKEE